MSTKKQYDAEFKAKVAIEALRNQKTLNEIASFYQVHPNRISLWKKQALSGIGEIFKNGKRKDVENDDGLIAQLYQQIGQLKVELDWLKKKCNA